MGKYFVLLLCLIYAGDIIGQSVYIDRAIAAADHERKRPLAEAIEYGFNGVSAEIELKKDGKLYCGSGTFRERYLEPLMVRSNNGQAFIHPEHTDEFLLFLEVTSDSSTTYAALKKELEPYHAMLTSFEGSRKTKKPVRLVLSGKVPHQVIYSETVRRVFCEDMANKLDQSHDGTYCTVASLKMKKLFDWKGEGTMPNMAYHSLGSYMKNAHKLGRWVRVYDLPEIPNAFDIIYEAGADYLEIKDLKSFSEYWKKRKPY